MCGIAGILSKSIQPDEMEQKLNTAQRVQAHRGPDAAANQLFQAAGWQIGFAFQRLAILDLSEAGNQPMQSASGQSWIIYNGEVYNYREVRADLQKEGCIFKTECDTEVVLTALEHWGPEAAMNRFNGMWAFAWLDLRNERIVLSKDRAGVKPLYYYTGPDGFYFSSEIKTILEMSGQKFDINMQVAGEYLLQSLLDTSNDTFFAGIQKAPAGHWCSLDLSQENMPVHFRPYWSLPVGEETVGSSEDLFEEVRALFFDAVRLRLRSDVPLGVLLSGGLDSSSIAAAMQQILGKDSDLNILSMVSESTKYDESGYIDIMGKTLGCPVHKVRIDLHLDNAMELLETVCWHNDEPILSFSNVAHYLLMEQARARGITVILSGQGADELLCGYLKYLGFYVQYLVRQGSIGEALGLLHSFYRRKTVLSQFAVSDAKRYLPSILRPREADIRGARLMEYQPVFSALPAGMKVQERQALDVQRFSVPTLVHYEDRMSMAHSREIRVPFLDYRLIEKLVRLPMTYKLNGGWTKYVMRRAMEPDLPAAITWRKDKQGFINPESDWLKHDLRAAIQAVFKDPSSHIYRQNIISREQMLKKYAAFCAQPPDRGAIAYKDIFAPLALEIWLRRFEKYIS